MTLNYDGVPGHENEPVVVAVFDIDPVELQLSDPGKPAWRRADSVVSTAAAKAGETHRTTRGNRRQQRQGHVASCQPLTCRLAHFSRSRFV
jgi:hypothetical protein